MQVQLIVACSLRERLSSCCRVDGVTDLPPEVCPVQNAGRLRKMLGLFLLDPLSPVCDDDHGARGVATEPLCCGFGLLAKRSRWAKRADVAPPSQTMSLSWWASRSPLAPRKRGGEGWHRQILHLGTDHGHLD